MSTTQQPTPRQIVINNTIEALTYELELAQARAEQRRREWFEIDETGEPVG